MDLEGRECCFAPGFHWRGVIELVDERGVVVRPASGERFAASMIDSPASGPGERFVPWSSVLWVDLD
jgi:hypothetical protein